MLRIKTNSRLCAHLAKSSSEKKLFGRTVIHKNQTRISCPIIHLSVSLTSFKDNEVKKSAAYISLVVLAFFHQVRIVDKAQR